MGILSAFHYKPNWIKQKDSGHIENVRYFSSPYKRFHLPIYHVLTSAGMFSNTAIYKVLSLFFLFERMHIKELLLRLWAPSLVAQMVKNLPAVQETWVRSLVQEDPLEKGMTTHSSILAWRIPWMEKLGRLPFLGVTRVRHS